MPKLDLQLDFDAIRKRIEIFKRIHTTNFWAELVNVSPDLVVKIHGKEQRKPSLEYVIAVALATGKSIDFFLWGYDRETI